MKYSLKIIILLCCFASSLQAQPKKYAEQIKEYQASYVQAHEVVLEEDKKYFRFYKANKKYRVMARFEKLTDTVGFIMKTSGTKDKKFFRYGKIHFTLNDRPLSLTVYQSEQLMTDTAYQDYLFLPFTDLTSGTQSYGGGRYLDPTLGEIRDNTIEIDFNKAYNPYCAYATGYNCPIPPRENDLPVAIKAGEKAFGKKDH